MDVRFILVADTANVSQEGKLNITGEFNQFFASKVPFGWPSMSVVARLEASLAEGLDHAGQIKITDADGQVTLETPPVPVKFAATGTGLPARANLIANFVGAVFPRYGDYAVNLFVDGVLRGSAALYVRRPAGPTPPQGGQLPPARPSR